MLLELVFLLAVVLVNPIGVSTQSVILDRILEDIADPSLVVESAESSSGYASPNAYLNKSGGKYAEAVANPMNYSFIFVVALFGGALISGVLRGGVSNAERNMPAIWRADFEGSYLKRFLAAFVAGFIVLYGARLAGGCTSGHTMSSMMQTAVSGYSFAAGAFLASIPTAIWLFGKGG